jgi:hypothetical protein
LDDQIDKIKDAHDNNEFAQLNSSISEMLFGNIKENINTATAFSKHNNKLTTEVNILTKLLNTTQEKWTTESTKKAEKLLGTVTVADRLVRPAAAPEPSAAAPQAAAPQAAAPEAAAPEAAPEVPKEIKDRLDAITIGVNRALGNLDLPIKDKDNNSYKIFPKVTLQVIKQPQQLQGGTRKSVSGSHSRKVSNPKRATTRRKNNNNRKISNNKIKTRNNKIKISSKISSSTRRRISKRHKSVRH